MVRYVACSLAALIAVAAPELVWAQTSPQSSQDPTQEQASQLGDVVVTARRREEAVRDVPSTITALSSDALEQKSPIESAGDLLQTVPGVRFNGVQSENLAEVSVRGSGTQRATSADSGVGLFVNGAYAGSSTLGGRNFKRIDYFDIARVEVLEGPQGALYGRNSEFGSVNIVLAQPQFRNGGRVSATYLDDLSQLRLEGVVNQQLGEKVAIRLGAQVTGQGGGIYYNPNRDTYYDHTDGYLVRGQIRYMDGPLDVTLLVDAQDMNLPTFVNQWVLPAGRLAVLPMGYTGPRYNVPSDVNNDLHQTVQRGMLMIKYDMGWGQLTSTTMGLKFTSVQNFAAAIDLATQGTFQANGWVGLYPLGGTTTDVTDRTFYQDVHITSEAMDGQLEWMVGAEALFQEDHYIRDSRTSPCTLTATSSICGGTPTAPVCYRLIPTATACPATFPLPFGSRRIVPSEFRSAALYGSLKYDIGNLSLSGELRYSRDQKEATQTDVRLYTTTLIGAPSTYTFEEDNVSYAASASYRLNDSTLLYARTGTGYRAGGVNNGTTVAVAPNPLQPTYDNETTTAYEIGVKSELTDNIFLRLSAYQSRTEDAIALVSDGCTIANVCGAASSNFNINGGTMEVQGIEASLDAIFEVFGGRLAVGLNGANQDATYVEVITVPGAPLLNSQVAQTPDWTYSANVNYRRQLGGRLFGFANVAFNGQTGGGQDTVTATVPFVPLYDVENVDLRWGLTFNRVEMAMFVRNATNQEIPVLQLQQAGIPLVNRYSRPRSFGASVTYRW